MTISKGKIVRYDPQRLFGFIRPSCGGVDMFFHLSDLETGNFTDRGEHSKYIQSLVNTEHTVEYLTRLRTNKQGKGQLCAKEVEIYLT